MKCNKPELGIVLHGSPAISFTSIKLIHEWEEVHFSAEAQRGESGIKEKYNGSIRCGIKDIHKSHYQSKESVQVN